MNEARPQIYAFDEFRLDVDKRLLTKAGSEQIPLTPKVFDTLLYLVRNTGKVIAKDELMGEIWTDSVVEENNLNQNISILRRVFGEKPGEQRFIVTVAGHGYRFVPEVRSVSEPRVHNADVDRGHNAFSPDLLDPATAASIENPKSKIQNRTWLIALTVFTIFVLSFGGFYVWRSRSNETHADAPIQTIAVLPFKPLVVDHRNEELEFGLADTLISKLSGREEIAVLPLSAIRPYTSVEQDSLTVGHELGVESVLDGTIQNWGDRIRISAKLIRISDGKQLWAGQFDEKFTDIFAVQDAISEKVAAALKIPLAGKQKKGLTDNVEAYQLYMKGRYLTAKGTPADYLGSISYFERAIDLDPQYALAYTGLAQAYGVLGIMGAMPTTEAFPKARAAEQKALEIDDTLGYGHVALCMGLFWYDWDWAAAEKECVRALELDPNNADFHGYYAQVLSSTGQHDKALALARRSRELNPLNLAQTAFEGQFLTHAGRSDEAIDHLLKLSNLEPNFPLSHLFAASAYIEKGMFAEAIAESRKEFEITGRNEIPFGLYAMARSGKRDQARAELTELLKSASTKYLAPYNVALIYNGLQDPDAALEWLEKGYELRDPKMTFLKVEPKWNNLRGDARFIDLMRRMNF